MPVDAPAACAATLVRIAATSLARLSACSESGTRNVPGPREKKQRDANAPGSESGSHGSQLMAG